MGAYWIFVWDIDADANIYYVACVGNTLQDILDANISDSTSPLQKTSVDTLTSQALTHYNTTQQRDEAGTAYHVQPADAARMSFLLATKSVTRAARAGPAAGQKKANKGGK